MQVTVVTLLVTPEQAETLALASTEGKIQLALRNPLDQGAPQTPGIRPAVLLGTARGAAPRPARRVGEAEGRRQPVSMTGRPGAGAPDRGDHPRREARDRSDQVTKRSCRLSACDCQLEPGHES